MATPAPSSSWSRRCAMVHGTSPVAQSPADASRSVAATRPKIFDAVFRVTRARIARFAARDYDPSLMPRGVVFDLDGTLVDSLRDIAIAMDRALEDLALPRRTLAEYERFIGDGARMLVRRAIGDAPCEEEALERFRARYSEHLVVHTRAYPGVDALLAELARRGVPTAVLSNKPHAWTEEIVRTLFPEHPFARVLGHRPDAPHKPDPTSALELAQALLLPSERILFVGDTAVDVETARRAGMISVAVLWGMRTREELAGAAFRISEPSELLTLLND